MSGTVSKLKNEIWQYKLKIIGTVYEEEMQKIRKLPIQELIVDLHIESKGLAFSCYKSIFIFDFETIDTSDSLFYGTMTKI